MSIYEFFHLENFNQSGMQIYTVYFLVIHLYLLTNNPFSNHKVHCGSYICSNPFLMKLKFLLISLLFCTLMHAQDKVLMMSGIEYECEFIEDNGVELVFEVTKKNGKKKQMNFHKSSIFSYTLEKSDETILYSQDEFLGDDFTIQEMRIYLAGEQDARAGYNNKPTALGGIGFSGFVTFFAGAGFITILVSPIAYAVGHMIPRIKIKEETITDARHRFNEIYAMGYESVARSKKVFGALIGGAIGSLAGSTLNLLIE